MAETIDSCNSPDSSSSQSATQGEPGSDLYLINGHFPVLVAPPKPQARAARPGAPQACQAADSRCAKLNAIFGFAVLPLRLTSKSGTNRLGRAGSASPHGKTARSWRRRLAAHFRFARACARKCTMWMCAVHACTGRITIREIVQSAEPRHILPLSALSIHRDYTIAHGALPTLDTPPTMCGRAAVAARQAVAKHFT